MNYNCPHCQSKNTKKLSMVYATGTRRTNGSHRGLRISSRGRIGAYGGSSQSVSQSALASAIQLPKQSSLAKIVTAVLVIAFVIPSFSMMFAPSPDITTWKRILAFILFVITAVGTYFAHKFLNRGYEKHKKDFQNAFICMRCGNVFDPNLPQSIR